jgi:hypothetical protein
VAEVRFWGCGLLSTSVSCVPFMLGLWKPRSSVGNGFKKDCSQIEMLSRSPPSRLANAGGEK